MSLTDREFKECLRWLESIEANGVNLTPWEEEFVADMRERFNRYGANVRMSDSQLYQLERIYTDRVR